MKDEPLVEKSDSEEQKNQASELPAVNELRFNHPAGLQALIDVVRLSDLRTFDVPVPIYHPTRRDFHVIKIVTEGQGKHWIEYESVDIKTGDILYLRPGQTHCFNRESQHDALLIVFRPEAEYDPTALQLVDPNSPKLTTKPEEFKSLVDIATQIDLVIRREASFNVHRVSQWLLGALTTAVGQLATAQVTNSSESSRLHLELVNAFQQLLESNFDERRRVSWFAGQLQTTERTLSRACKEIRGRSAKELLDTFIALAARRRLLLSEDSVETVAHSLGFSETTNFVKFFRRVVGTTPAEFRSLWLSRQ